MLLCDARVAYDGHAYDGHAYNADALPFPAPVCRVTMPPKARRKVITLKERFDRGALSYIIDNFASFNFRPETDFAATLDMIRRYMAGSSDDGYLTVSYARASHGHGRYFAYNGLSMQGMPREIRNAIAFRIHHDLDFVNCHPSLLHQFSLRHGVPCPRLAEYVADRTTFLADLQDGASIPGAAKTAVLAVIYGGAVDSVRRGVDPHNCGAPWLRAFGEEMAAVREAVTALPSAAPYLALARKSVAKKATAAASGDGNNLLGSTVNHLVCDLENAALMALREFLESNMKRTVGVLVFDGLVVERLPSDDGAEIPREVLDAASDHVFRVTGYRLRISEKDMAVDKLDVPREAYAVWGAADAAYGSDAWDCSRVVNAAASVIHAPADGVSDVHISGSHVLFKCDGVERTVDLATLCVEPGRRFLHAEEAAALSCGSVVLPNSTVPACGWSVTRPSDTVRLQNDGPPRIVLNLDMEGANVVRAVASYPDSGKTAPLKGGQAMLDMLGGVVRGAIRKHLEGALGVPHHVVNNVVFNNTGNGNQVNIFNVNASEEDVVATPLAMMRDVVLAYATTHHLRKLGDSVWRPVEGCPLAYELGETFKVLLNNRLRHEPAYRARSTVHKELVEMLTILDLAEIRDVVWDLDLFSFTDGVFVRSVERFVPYSDAIAIEGLRGSGASAAADDDDPAPLIARVHVRCAFLEGVATPLIDKVLADQFSAEVIGTFYVLVGRLFYRIGERDKWQVMPWFVGRSGTGKSLIMDIIACLFFKGAVGVLSSNNEQVFGLADKCDKQLLMGRDLPRNMSAVLAQDVLQSMVTGEDVSVPVKNLSARTVKWTTPIVFCSNHMPDYADNAGQIVRRIVVFPMPNAVEAPEMDMLDRIRETELPAFLSKALRAYHAAVLDHGNRTFWSWCPEELRVAQRRLGSETSLVRRFMTLGPDDPEAVVDDTGGVTYPLRELDGRSTALAVVVRAYNAFVARHHPEVKAPEKMTKESLAVAGFALEDRVNTCHACGRTGLSGRRARCCDQFNASMRARGMVVKGVVLVLL